MFCFGAGMGCKGGAGFMLVNGRAVLAAKGRGGKGELPGECRGGDASTFGARRVMVRNAKRVGRKKFIIFFIELFFQAQINRIEMGVDLAAAFEGQPEYDRTGKEGRHGIDYYTDWYLGRYNPLRPVISGFFSLKLISNCFCKLCRSRKQGFPNGFAPPLVRRHLSGAVFSRSALVREGVHQWCRQD